jgi:hypothetical protein
MATEVAVVDDGFSELKVGSLHGNSCSADREWPAVADGIRTPRVR